MEIETNSWKACKAPGMRPPHKPPHNLLIPPTMPLQLAGCFSEVMRRIIHEFLRWVCPDNFCKALSGQRL